METHPFIDNYLLPQSNMLFFSQVLDELHNLKIKEGGGSKPTITSYNFDKVWSGASDGRFGK